MNVKLTSTLPPRNNAKANISLKITPKELKLSSALLNFIDSDDFSTQSHMLMRQICNLSNKSSSRYNDTQKFLLVASADFFICNNINNKLRLNLTSKTSKQ